LNQHLSLIVGKGLIGKSLSELISKSSSVIIAHKNALQNAPNEVYLDLEDLSSFNCPKDIKVAYICASKTNKNYCENNPSEAHTINVINSLTLIKKLRNKNIFVVFLSSVEVFPGNKSKYEVKDKTNPTSSYGRFKEEVEKNLANDQGCSIIRMTKVLDKSTPIIMSWSDKLFNGKTIAAFDNVLISPISARYASEKIYSIGTKQVPGIFHISGSQDISYYSLLTKLKLKHFYTNKILKQSAKNMPKFASLRTLYDMQNIDSVINDISKV